MYVCMYVCMYVWGYMLKEIMVGKYVFLTFFIITFFSTQSVNGTLKQNLVKFK